jgi:hypothetical protein
MCRGIVDKKEGILGNTLNGEIGNVIEVNLQLDFFPKIFYLLNEFTVIILFCAKN